MPNFSYLCIRKIAIGRWCNGNTTGFGSVIPGSNPSRPTTKRIPKSMTSGFFFHSTRHLSISNGEKFRVHSNKNSSALAFLLECTRINISADSRRLSEPLSIYVVPTTDKNLSANYPTKRLKSHYKIDYLTLHSKTPDE